MQRYRPKFIYREKNWTSNLFRVYEQIFGRRFGIRLESSAYASIDNYGNKTQYVIAYSTEAKIAFLEQYFRQYISFIARKFKQYRLPEFNLFDTFRLDYALAGISYIPKTDTKPSGYMFAIALDTSASAVSSTVSTVSTASYTVTGSDVMMLAGVPNQSNAGSTNWATNTSGVTCNGGGQSLSKIAVANGDATSPGYGQNVSMWSREAPSSGVVTATRNTPYSDGFMICVETLSGVDQTITGSSIANTVQSNGSTAAGTITSSTVTCPTNGWVAMSTYIATGTTATAGTGTTRRQTASAFGYLWDSNGTVSGSQSLQWTTSDTNDSFGQVIVAVGPAGAAPTANTGFFALM